MKTTKTLTAVQQALKTAREDIKILRLAIADKKSRISVLRFEAREEREAAIAAKVAAKEQKQADRESKKAARIAKLQERLAKLQSPSLKREKRKVKGSNKWSVITKVAA